MNAIIDLKQKGEIASQWIDQHLLRYQWGTESDQHLVYLIEEDMLLEPWPQIVEWVQQTQSQHLNKNQALIAWKAQISTDPIFLRLLEEEFDWQFEEVKLALSLGDGESIWTNKSDTYRLGVFCLKGYLFKVSFILEDQVWTMQWAALQDMPERTGLLNHAIELVKKLTHEFLSEVNPLQLCFEGVEAKRSQYYSLHCPHWFDDWVCKVTWVGGNQTHITFTKLITV